MNKQRNAALEMAVIAAFLGGLCFLVWNINPYSSPKPTATKSTEHTPPSNTSSKPTIRKDENWEEGKTLFRSYCASCHNPTENSLGPVLAGSSKRWENAGSYKGKTGDQWMKAWVRNWKDVVASGYPYAIEMAKSREAEMNLFNNLTDKQIELILYYADMQGVVAAK